LETAFSIFLTAFSLVCFFAIFRFSGEVLHGIVQGIPFCGVACLLPRSAPRSFCQWFPHQVTENPFDSARAYAFSAASTPTEGA
jgi:hypothetical protein